jgi:hypothetical protein
MEDALKRVGEWLFYHGPDSFLKRYFANFKNPLFYIFVIGGFWLSGYLSHLGLFEYAALQAGDSLMREAGAKLPQRAQFVRIVAIEPTDFDKYFGGRTPYPVTPFAYAVCTLMRAKPALLIVDLDTSHADFKRMPPLPTNGVPVVWARAAHEDGQGQLIPEDVLGGRELAKGETTGLAVYFLSLDWSVREYPRVIDTKARTGSPSLHWAAIKAYCARSDCPELSHENPTSHLEVPVFDRYFDFDTFSMNEFNPTTCPVADQEDQRLTGKIIIFGGRYSSADLHKTAFGHRPGAEIVGSAIEHELHLSRSRFMTNVEKYAAKLLLLLIVLAIHTAFRPVAAMFVTVLGLGVLIWQGAWLAYHFIGYRASVVPFLVGILIEQLTTSAEGADHPAHGAKGGP